MKKRRIFLLIFLFFPFMRAEAACSCAAKVRAVLDTQQQAWNRGDLEGFMAGYDNSADLRFVSGRKVADGWQQTLDNYKKAYPDKASMGILRFGDLQITCTGAGHAFVSGTWELNYENNTSSGGRFTLIFRKKKSNWKIVYDHTS